MLNNKTVAVVVPAHNEQKQITGVIRSMPKFVDRIIVVNDASTDQTANLVKKLFKEAGQTKNPIFIRKEANRWRGKYNRANKVLDKIDSQEIKLYTPFEILNEKSGKERLILINHKVNNGPGAAIASGYRWARDHNIDCTAVMAGDGQMDPAELKGICMPVVDKGIDYVKANRLSHRSAYFVIPRVRFFGNSILSLLTKIASGYWHVSDTQSGYTAISLSALKAIRIHNIYKGYGTPNDILVKLNIAFCTIKEVASKPVYNVGEESKMYVWKVIPSISWLLTKSFFKRLYIKYLLRDFHPLFLLYNLGFLLFILCIPIGIHLYNVLFLENRLPVQSLIIFTFLIITSFQSLFFAMWMDMQDNERLHK